MLFLENSENHLQNKHAAAGVRLPPLDLFLSRWSEPAQAEYLKEHCQTLISDPVQAALIVLNLISIRANSSKQRSIAKQTRAWAVDCLTRVWVIMDGWKLLVHLRPTYHILATSYLEKLRMVFSGVSANEYQTVSALKLTSLLSRSVASFLQLCNTGLYPTLEQLLSFSLMDLLRLPRELDIYSSAFEQHILPVLKELTVGISPLRLLSGELQVNKL